MFTVRPSIVLGSYGWDEDRLPRDEFQLRIDTLNRAMDARGWKAVLAFGDTERHSALAYFTNFIPRTRWALALLPRTGEPRLLASMSSRDIPAMRQLTWIADVRSAWEWESGFESWLASVSSAEPVDLGALGFEAMPLSLLRSVEKTLGDRFRLQVADALMPTLCPPRPRELSLLREAADLARDAGDAMVSAWRRGKGAEQAALEAERCARTQAAQDVRTLMSLDGGRSLVPCRGAFAGREDRLLGYIAVKRMGYWAELFVTASTQPNELLARSQAALAAALQAVRPGVPASAIYEKAVAPLGALSLHPVLGGRIGRRIGLSLDEGGAIRRDSTHAFAPGQIYAIHLGVRESAQGGAVVGAMIAVGEQSVEILCRSPD